MKKFVCALFLLLVCAFSFLGGGNALADFADVPAQNAFRIVRQADASGKIALSYIFPVNSEILSAEGFSETEIKTYRFYLSTYVNAVAGQNREKGTEGVTISNCTYFTDVDGLGFSMIFDNLAAQKRFFNVEESEEEDGGSVTKASGFFIRKVEMFTSFPVSSQKSANDLRLVCEYATTSWCKDNNISAQKKQVLSKALQESVFVYDFATTQKQIKSENMYDDENFHHNVFIKTYAQLDTDNQIVFFTTQPNTPVWYACALVVVIAGMGVAYLVLKNKEKPKTEKCTKSSEKSSKNKQKVEK